MLLPNIIPEKEPLIRVGIILPEDKQKSVVLEFMNSPDYAIWGDNKKISEKSVEKLLIEIEGDNLKVLDKRIQRINIKQNKPEDFITVKKVIAGRGFHWAKNIEVKLTYDLELKVIDSNIVLINEMPLEEYLACVATSEMSSECPDSYIEAQTIVARSWMLANVEQKHIDLGFDVCNDDCCQRFQGINNLTIQSRNAAKKTAGQVLMFEKKIVDARYSKSCGGIMERFENLWENDPKPYMQNKSDALIEFDVDLTKETQLKKWVDTVPASFCSPHYIKEANLHKYLGNVDEQGKYFRWKIETTQSELVENIKDKLQIDIKSVLRLIPLSRGGSGRILKLQINYLDNEHRQKTQMIYKDYEVRRVLHKMFLYSSAIDIEEIYKDDRKVPSKYIFKGAGWGHGAGMCQIGGLGMSLAGYDAEQIVKHYYPGSELRRIY